MSNAPAPATIVTDLVAVETVGLDLLADVLASAQDSARRRPDWHPEFPGDRGGDRVRARHGGAKAGPDARHSGRAAVLDGSVAVRVRGATTRDNAASLASMAGAGFVIVAEDPGHVERQVLLVRPLAH